MLITFLIALILIALCYWVITSLPLPPMVQTIATVVLVVLVVVWLLGLLSLGQ